MIGSEKFRAWLKHPGCNGKSDAPPPPDYVGAAQATSEGNIDAARAAAAANRVNQVTPYGKLTYSQNPSGTFDQTGYNTALDNYYKQLSAYNNAQTGGYSTAGSDSIGTLSIGGKIVNSASALGMSKPVMPNQSDFWTGSQDDGWTATQTLAPGQQAILDKNTALSSGLLDTAQSGLDYASGVMSKPGVDTSKLAQVGINPGQSYQDAMMARLRPQIDYENQASDAQLANQGITPGSTAYNNAKRMLYQQHNDLLNNATVQGFNTGLAANQTGFQQEAYNQMQPINVINALRTGSQVQGPNFVGVPQQQTTGGPDIMGATTAGYNAQVGNVNSQNAQAGQTAAGVGSIALAAVVL